MQEKVALLIVIMKVHSKKTEFPQMTTIGANLGETKFYSLDLYDISGKDIPKFQNKSFSKQMKSKKLKDALMYMTLPIQNLSIKQRIGLIEPMKNLEISLLFQQEIKMIYQKKEE